MRKTPTCDHAADPALRAASRFGLRVKDLKAPARAALAALQVEAESAAREIEALQERLVAAEALADHDPLIPVLNRRAFLAALQRTISSVGRYGGAAAVLFVDMDDLKLLNDQFGHATGDAALRHLGRALVENVRGTDTVGRLGGDEFGVILERAGMEEARHKLAALQNAITAAPLVHEDATHAIRASIGIHVLNGADNAEDAIARADEAMYAAKRARKGARAESTR